MKKICLIALTFAAMFAASVIAEEPEVDEGVLVLTDKNFDETVAKHEYLLVEFYAPWCGHCKTLAPEYAKAAQRLGQNNPPYYLAKVDATENKEIAEKFGIKGFPTLFFLKNGEKQEYNGGRVEDEIVNWVLKKVGPPSAEVTCDELKQKAESTKLLVAYIGEKDIREHSEVYQQVAAHAQVSDKFSFVHLSDKECASSYGASSTPAVLIFRKFDDSPLVFSGEWEVQKIVDWLTSASVPTLIDFSEDYIEPIFGQKKPTIVLFRNKEESESDYATRFAEAAKELKGEVLFVVSGVKDGIQSRLAEFIGVVENQLPQITLFNPADAMKKFQFPHNVKEATLDHLKSFVQDFKANKLSPFLKSEEVPADNSEPVKIVVGKNFKDIVLNDNDDVLMEFYAPWCGHCKKLAPIWDQVAADLKDVPNLVLAKMDSTANEVDGVEIQGYPTLKFYPKGNKGSPIDFDGGREAEDIKTWLKEKSQAYKTYSESKGDL